MRHHDDLLFMQCALSFLFPWAAFYTAEAFELSGIVAIMCAGAPARHDLSRTD